LSFRKQEGHLVKLLAIILSIAVAGVTLATSASASKMNGKCCQWSDGGRSYRYQMAMRRAAIPHTCSAYAASCVRDSLTREDRMPMCMAAKAQCIQSGMYVGPYSGRTFFDMTKL
jgi:hypothetical protein